MTTKAIGNHRNAWRAREVALKHFERDIAPVKFNGNARRRIYAWKMAMLQAIHKEVDHKRTPEIMAEVEVPAFRHKSANRRKTDGRMGAGLPHFYTMGADDAGADLSASNNVGFAMLANAAE